MVFDWNCCVSTVRRPREVAIFIWHSFSEIVECECEWFFRFFSTSRLENGPNQRWWQFEVNFLLQASDIGVAHVARWPIIRYIRHGKRIDEGARVGAKGGAHLFVGLVTPKRSGRRRTTRRLARPQSFGVETSSATGSISIESKLDSSIQWADRPTMVSGRPH